MPVTVAAPAAWSAEPPGAAASVRPDSELYIVQSGAAEPIGFATVEARSGPDGSEATGTFSVHYGGGNGPTYSGTVTCLSVGGNRAAVGVEGELWSWGETLPIAGVIHLVDGGPPSHVTVTDSPSKEQCKRGGWAAFGFDNQGRCVASTQRAGRS